MKNPFQNFFSKPEQTQTQTQTTTGGSATGEAAGQWGLEGMKGLIAQGATGYGGPMPGSQGPNAAQIQQYNMLTGMQGSVPGAVSAAVGQMTPQQIAEANRRGGPHAGYRNPYEQQVIGGLKQDYQDALAMGRNKIGMGAHGVNAFGGSRHGAAEGVMGAKAKEDFIAQAGQLSHRGFGDQMGWQRQDARDRASDIREMNIANLGFGGLRRDVAQADIANQFGVTDRFGRYGANQQAQQNMADMYGYNEFTRQQDYVPNLYKNYFSGMGVTPWQTTSTTTGTMTGEGKSPFETAAGLGLAAAGAYGSFT